ncbi:MAG: TIGR00282 family metallophosphoesterase [Clostridia bacterium]|nr:TIGR00282 family metallophosphoesterase [Clostridia bacterium]
MRILFIGDIVGRPGRKMVFENLPRLIEEKAIDFTIANGENTSGGFGLTQRNFSELVDCGVDAFTMGNHIWDNKDIYNYIDEEIRLVRPANYPASDPGRCFQEFTVQGERLIITNIVGSIYMTPAYDNPFQAIDALLKQLPCRDEAAIFVDFHAEATSEKMAMGWFLDGRVSALVGTHTHIQTNDARILPRGTGYLTDAGMTGPRDSVLGVDKDIIVNRFLTGFSSRFEPARGDIQMNGVIFDIGSDHRVGAMELLNFWQPSL